MYRPRRQPSGAHLRRPSAARGKQGVAAGVRPERVRTSCRPGRPPVLQWAPRGGSSCAWLWTPHSGTTRQPSQGADVYWRIRWPGASPRSAVIESGGEIRGDTIPHKIHVENGRATGIETTDGSMFRARHFVASALNPIQTFIELIDARILPLSRREKRRLTANSTCLRRSSRLMSTSGNHLHIWQRNVVPA
jgi:hypothetical protein